MLFAFVNDNVIKKIEEWEDYNLIPDAYYYQIVVDVSDYTYGPEVGWAFVKGIFRLDLPNATPRQVRQALILSGVSMAQIETALNSLPEPTKSLALVEWEYSTAFIRYNPLVSQVGAMLGWTEKQIDDLWKLALKL